MGKYVPTAITYQDSGLVRNRDAFVLADDAYQTLDSIYQWRGRLRRKYLYGILGRLRRLYSSVSYFETDTSPWSFDLLTESGYIQSIGIVGSTLTITTFTDHGLSNSDSVVFSGVGGTTEINGNTYTVANKTDTTFEITQAGASAFTSGGFWMSDRSVLTTEPNASIQCGSVEFTIASETITDDGAGVLTGDGGGGVTAASGTINYATGAVTLTHDHGTAVAVTLTMAYFPTLPCMGIPSRELAAINSEQTVVFDTTYCYRFNNTTNAFEELSPPVTWSGTDSQFFYSLNYWQTSDNSQYFWTTNFSGTTGDPIRLYDGSGWYDFAPTTEGSNEMHQALILVPYKGRVVALNTYEGGTLATSLQYPQRARWSQNGAPLSSVASGTAPTATVEWKSDVKGRGGYVDCPTNEHIISAEFVRDVLIVGFENSTWALRYTGNEILPFVWDRINKELGTESTFSTVAFDKGVVAIGDRSINSCDGNNVQRIDEDIPDQVFDFHNSFDPSSELSDGTKRVHGIRDFYERIVYWTYPDGATGAKFPDKTLVFNYHNKTWAIFPSGFTALGQWQRFNDRTWSDLVGLNWESANFSWVSAQFQSQFATIIGGNQHGFIRILNDGFNEQFGSYVSNPSDRATLSNAPHLAITGITGGASRVSLDVADHNLQDDDYVLVSSVLGTGADELNGRVFQVVREDADTIELRSKPRTDITAITQATQAVITSAGHTLTAGDYVYIDGVVTMTEINTLHGQVVSVSGNSITVDIDTSGFTAYGSGGSLQNLSANVVDTIVASGTYSGCGVLTKMLNFEARSKKFNMLKEGRKNFLGHMDFLARSTQDGEVSVDIYTDYNDSVPVNSVDDEFFNKVFNTTVSEFDQPQQDKVWHRFFCPMDCQFFEYRLRLSDRQMYVPSIQESDVLIDAIIIWSERGGRLVNP